MELDTISVSLIVIASCQFMRLLVAVVSMIVDTETRRANRKLLTRTAEIQESAFSKLQPPSYAGVGFCVHGVSLAGDCIECNADFREGSMIAPRAVPRSPKS